MVEEMVLPTNEIPPHLKWQILSFLRIEWSEGFAGPNRLRDWISREEDHPISFMFVEQDILISHAEVVWKHLSHEGQTYKIFGLAGVFTYPPFRKQGYGTRVVSLATHYIDKFDADLGVVFTQPHLEDFYSRCGWIPIEEAVFMIGPKDHPVACDQMVLMRFLSENGRKCRKVFEKSPVYFGETAW